MLLLARSAHSAAITIMLILRPIQVWWKPKLLLLIKRKPIPSSRLTNKLQVNAKIFLKGLTEWPLIFCRFHWGLLWTFKLAITLITNYIHYFEISRYLTNRPFPSSLEPLFQNESKCETFYMKMSSACSFIFMEIKAIFIRMVSHLDSLWNRGTRELGNGLLFYVFSQQTFHWKYILLTLAFSCEGTP